jgi:serine/threonine protein kinase
MTMSLSTGQSLGPYTIQGPLGAGGMGEVYRAHDARLNRDVAIKVIPSSVANDPEALAPTSSCNGAPTDTGCWWPIMTGCRGSWSGWTSPAAGERRRRRFARTMRPAFACVFGISRDAKYYVHTYARLLSDLYVVDGLK